MSRMNALVFALIVSSPIVTFADSFDYSLQNIPTNRRLLVKYILTSVLPHDKNYFSINQDQLQINCPSDQNKLCAALAQLSSQGNNLDYTKLKDMWKEQFLPTRANRGNEEIMKDTLKDFIAISKFKSWPNNTVNSRVKGLRRRIYRGKINGRRTSIAETLSETNTIRETEIVFERIQEAGNFEFYTYDESGAIALESEFPAGIRPAPIVCVACHMTRAGTASRFIRNDM